VLEKRIIELGGKLPSSDEIRAMRDAEENEGDVKVPEIEEVKLEKGLDDIDIGESNLLDMDNLNMNMMANRFSIARKATVKGCNHDIENMISLEEYQQKEDIIKQLMEELEEEKQKNAALRQELAELKERLNIADERVAHSIKEMEKFKEQREEYVQKLKNFKYEMDERDLKI